MHEASHITAEGRISNNTPLKNPVRIASSGKARKLSIIIPCFNEEATITSVLDRIAEVDLVGGVSKEVVIVNDASTDNTQMVIEQYVYRNPEIDIHYFSHADNQGKGAAIATGISQTTGDFIIIQDADLEYDPSEYNILLAPVLKGYADVVYGSRFMGGNPHRILFFWHTIGNRLLTFLCNMFSNLNLTDMETGYKLFRSEILHQIPLREKRFGFEPEVTIKLSRIPDIRIYEVGISYFGRTYKEGKKIGLKDAFRCVYCLIKYRLSAASTKHSKVQANEPAYH